jgi:DNA-directed RNA polymerase subunit F
LQGKFRKMILDRTPLNLNEVQELLKDIEDSEKKEEMEAYMKKFLKTKPAQAKKIKEDLEDLDLLKMKREHLVKIVDLLPKDASDLNKIFVDVSLSEEEVNKVLEIVKNSK